MTLDRNEINRVLYWAAGCDGESFIDSDDWPLIEKLAAAVGVDPASVVPVFADYRSDKPHDKPAFNWQPPRLMGGN